MIIIPARLKSSRFEHKVLADILGLPMFVKTAKQVESLDDVVIATDSQKVIDVAKEHNLKAVLTSEKHNSGTDRIDEACKVLDLDESEVVINVQADEPFIEKEVVSSVIERVKLSKKANDKTMIVSAYKKIDSELADDPNHVKVVLDSNKNATYFSRAKVPYNRDHQRTEYFGHLGIYGFTVKSLSEFCSLDFAPIEDIEKLEQLRAIYHGKQIAMVEVESSSFGIDTEADLKRAIEIFKN